MPRALAISAHPDDIEFMMAGTLILLRDAGYEIHYMAVADGSCGSVALDAAAAAEVRKGEARAAAEAIGAVYHPPICRDMEIFYERESLRKLAAVFREVEPEVLLTHPQEDYMEDHMNTSRLALTAAFARNMPNFQTLPPMPPTNRAVTVYHALPYGLRSALGGAVHAEFYVDVSAVMDMKRQMLVRHASQKEWLDISQGVGSYLEHLEALALSMGQMSGKFKFAEGWTRHLEAGYCGYDADPLRDALPSGLATRRA